MRITGLLVLGLTVAATSCRTGDGDGGSADVLGTAAPGGRPAEPKVAPPPLGMPGQVAPVGMPARPTFLDMRGESAAAKAVFDAIASSATGNGAARQKSISGQIYIYCSGPSNWSCQAGAAATGVPESAKRLPSPPQLDVKGSIAQKVFLALQAPEQDVGGTKIKSWIGSGELSCYVDSDELYHCIGSGFASLPPPPSAWPVGTQGVPAARR